MVESTRVLGLSTKVVTKRILIPRLSTHHVLLILRCKRFDSTSWILDVFTGYIVELGLGLMSIRPGLVDRFSYLLIMLLLLLVHVLHTITLEVIHCFSSLQLFFLVLELLEVADLRINLLLIALNNNIGTVSSNQNFGRHT